VVKKRGGGRGKFYDNGDDAAATADGDDKNTQVCGRHVGLM
jgi:hypothetical protein